MAKPRSRDIGKISPLTLDSVYLLKVTLYTVVGFQWFILANSELTKQIPIPAGFLIGLAFTMQERFTIDRKIEYAILLVSSLVGFSSQTGLLLSVL